MARTDWNRPELSIRGAGQEDRSSGNENATNIDSNQVTYFNSMYAINQHLGINAGIVKMACENLS